MKSNKKEYYLQAKRKAYQEVNHPTGAATIVSTATPLAPAPAPVVTAKKSAAVKVGNKGQAAQVSKVEVVSTEAAEPETVGTAAN